MRNKLTDLEKEVVLNPEEVMKKYLITNKDINNYNSRDDYDDSPRGIVLRKLVYRESLVNKYEFEQLCDADLSKEKEKIFLDTNKQIIDWNYIETGIKSNEIK